MFEQSWSVEVAVARKPSNRNIGSVCENTKVGNKPHPFTLNNIATAAGAKTPIINPAHKCHQRIWIGFKDAVGKMPWQQICRYQQSTAACSTDDVPHLVDRCHSHPTDRQQEHESRETRIQRMAPKFFEPLWSSEPSLRPSSCNNESERSIPEDQHATHYLARFLVRNKVRAPTTAISKPIPDTARIQAAIAPGFVYT